MTARSEEAAALLTSGAQEGGQEGPTAGEQPADECIAALLAENRTLRAENATLRSMKNALLESEGRYRRLFENDLTGDFVTTTDGRITVCNPAFVKIFGFASVNEALNTSILDLYEDPGERELLLLRLRKERKIENQGRTRKRRDGTRIHVVENLIGRFSPDGELIEIQGCTYDDSERKRVEEALRESMEWHRQALDSPLVGYAHCRIITDASGRAVDLVFLVVNGAFEAFSGRPREVVLNRRITETFDPAEVAELIAIYGDVALTGRSVTFEYRMPSLAKWHEVTAFSNRPGYTTAFFTDITKRKLAENALRESEERFRAVLENSLDAAYRRNLQVDRYDYMSPVIERILGFTAEEMGGMSIEEVMDRIHPDDRPSVGAKFSRAIASGQGLLVVYRFRAKHGEYRWLEDHFTTICDPDGRPLYRGGIVRDVTGRKEAEEELARAHRDLESAHREANLYLDILTHDIGNTENVSNLYAELLQDSLDGEAACYATSLKKSINKSIEILGIVSKIRRIHAGPPGIRAIDLDAVIREEATHFPDLPLRYEGVFQRVLADDLLCEVFTNLIGNAVKHGGPGVEVFIRAEDGGDGFLRVTVADTGRGAPDARKDEIFHHYEKKQRGVGEGLGLYLVGILIDRYGGKIWVEDRIPGRPEEGAAFSFLLREAKDEGAGRA
jgi:PAS domain S-box-containing protein